MKLREFFIPHYDVGVDQTQDQTTVVVIRHPTGLERMVYGWLDKPMWEGKVVKRHYGVTRITR